MTLSKSKISTNNSAQNGTSSVSQSQPGNFQECADCGSSNVQWASLNHGVIMCDECCLAHRSLGRCISVIKSLKKSHWPQSLIDTLYELVRCNSNQIWEAMLNNPNELNPMKQFNLAFKGAKKPSHKDNYSSKLNFIKIKYENLAFIARGKYSSIEDLNQQLFSTVKTDNYEATLRILSQGADANYRSGQEDGNTCLHTAVLSNQLGQIEMLCLYGADLSNTDRNGLTPYELARANSFSQIADRLIELQFELTDEFSYFLCGKRPEHGKGRHFLIPEPNDNNQEENTKHCSKILNLEELPDHLFDELAKDIYDEMDRRQIETIWKCTVGPNLVNEPIPFLVIKSCFTQTRNQLRQKLARFNPQEFSSLLIEILIESQRRFELIQVTKKDDVISEDEEDDPLYDKVPSDEDYASVASESSSTAQDVIFNKSEKNKVIKSQNKVSSGKNNTYVNVNANMQFSEAEKSSIATRSHSESPLKVVTPTICKLENTATTKVTLGSPHLSSSSSSVSNRSPKNTPSPSHSKFTAKECKILNTKFDKMQPCSFAQPSATPKDSTNMVATSLVANAESTLNSIINSLNRIDYSHLNTPSGAFAKMTSFRDNGISELKSENEMMKSMIERLMEENAQLRAEKMMQSTTAVVSVTSSKSPTINSTTNYITQNVNNYFKNEELNLYSTVNNSKKSFLSSVQNQNTTGQQTSKEIEMVLPTNRLRDNYFIKLENSEGQRSVNGTNDLLVRKLKKQSSISENNTPVRVKEKHSDDNLQIDENLLAKNNFFLQSSEFKMKEQSPSPSKIKLTSSKILVKQDSLPARSSSLQSKMPYNSSRTFSKQQHDHLHQLQLQLHHANNGSNQLQKSDRQLNLSSTNLKNFPSKDAVIKKMKKITKAVQELFKATKESDFVSLKNLCDRVCHSSGEMISLFPDNLNSSEIEQNLLVLDDNCKKLIDLITKCHAKLEHFAQMNKEVLNANAEGMTTSISNQSSLTSLALNGVTEAARFSPEDIQIKNVIVSNLVTYSYEIAHTVKRIVCIMGHSENTNL